MCFACPQIRTDAAGDFFFRKKIIFDKKGPGRMQFVEAKKLTDFTKGVSSIAFGPSHLGLQIASACNDGKV
jgi:hypothetical protein